MDEELDSFEAELKRLQPAPVSPELQHRLECELGVAAATRNRRWWLAAAALPIAAGIAVLLAVSPRGKPWLLGAGRHAATPIASDGTFKPISAEKVLYAAVEEGVVTLDDGTPARRERLQYVDTIKWQNPRTNASLTWSVPREEVRVVPIRYQ